MDPKQPNTPQDPPGKRRPPMPMRALLAWFLLMALLVTIFQLATQHNAKQASLPYNPDFLTLDEPSPAGAFAYNTILVDFKKTDLNHRPGWDTQATSRSVIFRRDK